jgi:hypothetical protein
MFASLGSEVTLNSTVVKITTAQSIIAEAAPILTWLIERVGATVLASLTLTGVGALPSSRQSRKRRRAPARGFAASTD